MSRRKSELADRELPIVHPSDNPSKGPHACGSVARAHPPYLPSTLYLYAVPPKKHPPYFTTTPGQGTFSIPRTAPEADRPMSLFRLSIVPRGSSLGRYPYFCAGGSRT